MGVSLLVLGRIAAALLSGVLLAQSFGLAPFWPLAWIAPIPLLIAIIGASRTEAFAYGALAGALSIAMLFDYFVDLGGPAPTAIITATKALIWGGIAVAVRAAARRLPAWAAVFVFPALMAGIETLLMTLSPHGSGGSLAYSQMNFLPAIQVASLGGAPAIVFVVTAFGAAVAFAVAKRAWAAAVAPILIVAASLAFGYARIPAPTEASSLSVTLLASDQFEGVPDDWRSVWAAYAPQIERAADANRRVILLPEKIAHLDPDERGAAIEQLAEIARRRDLLLIVGVDDETEEGRFNRAYVFTRAGWQIYDKRHMIPGLESEFAPGGGDLLFDHGDGRYGVAICKDMDFPALGRGYAGVDAIFVPAWDFATDAWLHGRMAMLRGVENGYSVIRSARNGALTVSDAFGAVRAEAPSGPQVAFDVEVLARSPGPTLYSRIGDAFGWAMLALAVALIGWTIWARRRAGAGE